MIRLLRIATFICIILAVATMAWVGFNAFKYKPAEHAIMQEPGPVEIMKKIALDTGNKDTVSPLVKQAKAFKLRIDPPEPPKPDPEERTQNRQIAENPNPEPQPRPEPKRVNVTRANFKLVGTCRYIDQPQKSLALIDLPAEGQKWVRLGETVRHHVIAEIGDDMVVLDQNGRKSNLYAPEKNSVSLLKNPPADSTTTSTVTAKAANIEHKAVPNQTRPSTQANANRSRGRKPPVSARKAPVKRQTPQERKKMLDSNIADIQQVMKRSSNVDATPEQKKQEMQAWSSLLKLLEEDRKRVEKQTQQSDNDKEQPEPKQAESEDKDN
ncbi:hypothetical protein STSP2_02828 [Anaerohalosphaera lusitana]|uniref:Type II secretion system protein GspC N-terminal domain-containing protein n=1 Tax=Anaerohalosphaera lusitana TaxID=1936003 RepID=A0A1U9NPG4_9BACT|nr:type II secretion system protein N [Anaerohalosphaera lusitana]AQT69634.1 hypothetical protein STSP2_02828 [Anaerohalosphaera lusitana]